MKRNTQPKSTKSRSTGQSGKDRNVRRHVVKATKVRQARTRKRTRHNAPRSSKELFAKPAEFQERWNRVTHVISKMRTDGISLRQASQEYGVDPRTVVLLGRSALHKGSNGRFKAKASDRLLRVLVIPTPDGVREIATRDSRQASQIAEYSNAVHKYLETGDDSALRKFRRKRIIDAKGNRVHLMTNVDELDRLGSAGVLSFESLYSQVG